MTTPNHGIQSAIIAYFIYPKWWHVLIAIILGIAPDIGRLFQKDKNNWNLFYAWSHETWYCYLIPYWEFILEKTILYMIM